MGLRVTHPLGLVLGMLVVIQAGLPGPAAGAAGSPPAGTWKPEAPTYGIGEHVNVPVTMSDGVVLRANVYYPTDPRTGAAARGPFPVIMVQTPYGKDVAGAASGREGGPEAATETGPVPYLITRGYIDVVAEVRGTGDSQGAFDLLNPIQGRDGAELVQWASGLEGANGRVGLYGPSYMGLNQFLTAARVAPGSPLKALFPIVAGADTYRDIAFDGGILDGEFTTIAVATVFGPLQELAPLAEARDVGDLITVESQHAPSLASYNLTQVTNIEAGGDQAYDEDYWQQRAPVNLLENIVDKGIPAYMVGGYFDLYQRGEPLDYSGLQNAFAHRPVGAPMYPRQPVTGRYQLMQGPWYHLTAGSGVDIYAIELAWFDRWLKGEPTGIERTRTPLHLYEIGAERWIDVAGYPLAEATPRTFYLDAGPTASGAPSTNDGALSPQPPASPASDRVLYTAATSPCDRQTEQWGAGGGALAFESGQLPPDPCAQDDRSLQSGPGALTYTSAPVTVDTAIAGPITATIYATANRPEVELVATVEAIGPSGASLPLTSGALLGSMRALDEGRTWRARDGRPLLPYHPYTRASVVAVPLGAVTRYDIEVFSTAARLAAGQRLRLTLTTSDTPHLLPTRTQAAELSGGAYDIQRGAHSASFVEVPMVAAASLPTSRRMPVTSAARRRCASLRRVTVHVARRGRIRTASVFINGRRARVARRGPTGLRIDLHGRASGTYRVLITARLGSGRRLRMHRTFHTCRPHRPRHRPRHR